MHKAVVVFGLGSNLGSPLHNMRRALLELRKNKNLRVISVSSLYESEAQLPIAAPAQWNRQFLNAAVACEFEPYLEAGDLLSLAKKIEKNMQSEHVEKWAPRLIDVDVLYWSRDSVNTTELKIPHQRLTERPFALLPLLELLPDAAVEKPAWANGWVKNKPFNTVVSRDQFWPQFVGILNFTPDSFSDGRPLSDVESLQSRAVELIGQGAEVLDIGAESTRPGALPVSTEEELHRLRTALKSVEQLKLSVKISVDCRHPDVLKAVISDYRVDYINDVTGFGMPAMLDLLKSSGCRGFAMHSLVVPPLKTAVLPEEHDPFISLNSWWADKLADLEQLGIPAERLVFDPGIGFGKTSEQAFYLLKNMQKFSPFQSEVMVGHSRKSYLSLFSDRTAPERDFETALVTQRLNQAFVQYLRVHDIESQKTAMRSKVWL